MKPTKLAVVIVLTLLLAACSPVCVRSAYVDPGGACGYRVRLSGSGGKDIMVSGCLSLHDATEMAYNINRDVAQHWSCER